MISTIFSNFILRRQRIVILFSISLVNIEYLSLTTIIGVADESNSLCFEPITIESLGLNFAN